MSGPSTRSATVISSGMVKPAPSPWRKRRTSAGAAPPPSAISKVGKQLMPIANKVKRRNEKPSPSDGEQHMPITSPVTNSVRSQLASSMLRPSPPATSGSALCSTWSLSWAATAARTMPRSPTACLKSTYVDPGLTMIATACAGREVVAP